MASAPKLNQRDGSGTAQEIVFTTNRERIALDGTVDVTIVDLQVSLDGGNYVSDPDLVYLDGTSFQVPNPLAHPDGLSLDLGLNTIQIRAIDILGGVSAPAIARITRILHVDDAPRYIPSGIKVLRRRDAVDLLVAKVLPAPVGTSSERVSAGLVVPAPDFRGFNIYASSSPGGSVSGYFRVNEVPAQAVTTHEEILSPITTYQAVWDAGGNVIRLRLTDEDVFGTELEVRVDQLQDTSAYSGTLRLQGTLESYLLQEYVKFTHVRAGGPGIINSDQFVEVPDASPLYYVITALYWDNITKTEFETPFSQEVLGLPLIIDTTLQDLPGRNLTQIVTTYVQAVQRVDTEISLIPGSTTRDVSIDPFASEAERLWFIVDFVHRSQSFLTLLQLDDANNDGVSDPVVSSSYKQALKAALGFTSDAAVQRLIDTQFDKLAANYHKTRLAGRPAVGQAVFYRTTAPTQDIPIPSGSIVATVTDATNSAASVRFRVGGTYTMRAAQAASYYNFDERRWEITTDITAESIGENGNRPAGQIKTSTISGLSVTNTEATVFGLSIESNADLAARCMLAFASVDTGTEGGYQSTSAAQTGVLKAKVVKSGDTLMMRDWDDVRAKHIGGKVDIWIQGLRERQVSDNFAFTFEVALDVRCQIIDIPTLTFRVLDSRVTVDTPITEILNNPSQGLGVRNVTLGQDYDVTTVTLVDYQTFRLSTAVPQPVTMVDDVITADFRFRMVHAFVFSLQPVRRVVSVVGELSGTLTPDTGYELYKTEDPLLNGESTIAEDSLVIHQVGGVPSGATITINDELHVLIGLFQEPLKSIGINTMTLRVYNEARTLEYDGPSTSAPDFDIVPGTPTTPVKIVRTAASRILSGQEVSVDYVHDENFVVTYVINDLLQELQRTIEAKRHTTADVLVKQAIQNSIDIETTVQLNAGAKKDTVDPAVRTNTSLELNKRYIGQGAAQSDVIHAVDATTGVDYQIVPMIKMAYADGSRKLREAVLSTATLLPTLAIGGNRAFILTNPLQYPTTDGGGLPTEHKGVFQDDVMMRAATTLSLVALHADSAFIIGASGAEIAGYSDDATLIAEGFTDPEDRLVEFLRRTANHVVVALSGSDIPPDEPPNHGYTVTYVVRGDVGAHDMTASEVEFLDLGEFTVTYKEATR